MAGGLAVAAWLERDTVTGLVMTGWERVAQSGQPISAPAPASPHAQAAAGTGAAPVAPGPGLDSLFEQLRQAEDVETAQRLETEIFIRIGLSASPTINVLMQAADAAEQAGDAEAAAATYADVVRLAPDYAEGYARAAAATYRTGDLDGAERMLRRALALEPRHFAAWVGLGTILEEKDDQAGALHAYREALYVNPMFDVARRGALRVEARIEGLAL